MARLTANVQVMVKAVEKAAKNLVRDFGEVENLQLSIKGPGDFVSAADKRAEAILQEELSRARPDFGFLMEENGEIVGRDPNRRWIIDPLDGTSNFLKGFPYWCIIVALEENNEITAAVTYDPLRDDLYWANKGGGAFHRHQRLRVSATRESKLATIGQGDNFVGHKDYAQYFKTYEAVNNTFGKSRCNGSMGLDLAYVASGKMDGYWAYKFSPWDCAAGILFLQEAGGFLTSPSKQVKNVIYGTEGLIAGNPNIHEALSKVLKGA